MTYAVKFGDEQLCHSALVGLLTEDSASPSLWLNIFFADYRLPPHKDDVSPQWSASLTGGTG
ncbi:hypothetical protein B0H19DRAFT_1184081, partial [Mycena capillaripes]